MHSRGRKRTQPKSRRSPKRTKSLGTHRSRPSRQRTRRFRACADGTCSLCQYELVPNDPAGVFHWACGNHLTHIECTYDMARSNYFQEKLRCPICRKRTEWSGQLNIRTEFDALLQSITNQPPGIAVLVLENIQCVNTSPESDEMMLIAEAIDLRKSIRHVRNGQYGTSQQVFHSVDGLSLIAHIGPYHQRTRQAVASVVKFDLFMQKLRLYRLMKAEIPDDSQMSVYINDVDGNIDYALLEQVLLRHQSLITMMELKDIKQGIITAPLKVRMLFIDSCNPQHIIRMALTRPSNNDAPQRRVLQHLTLSNMTCAKTHSSDHNDPNLFFPQLNNLSSIRRLAFESVKFDCHITRQLAEVVKNVEVWTLRIVSCTFRDENNTSSLHLLLSACLAQAELKVTIRTTEFGPNYPPSFTWPENWDVTAPPRRRSKRLQSRKSRSRSPQRR